MPDQIPERLHQRGLIRLILPRQPRTATRGTGTKGKVRVIRLLRAAPFQLGRLGAARRTRQVAVSRFERRRLVEEGTGLEMFEEHGVEGEVVVFEY